MKLPKSVAILILVIVGIVVVGVMHQNTPSTPVTLDLTGKPDGWNQVKILHADRTIPTIYVTEQPGQMIRRYYPRMVLIGQTVSITSPKHEFVVMPVTGITARAQVKWQKNGHAAPVREDGLYAIILKEGNEVVATAYFYKSSKNEYESGLLETLEALDMQPGLQA